MKATIDIPEDLYRRVKAKSAMQGQCVREVAVNLFRGWIEEVEQEPIHESVPATDRPVPAWFGSARKYARRVDRHDIDIVRRSIALGRASETPAGKRAR